MIIGIDPGVKGGISIIDRGAIIKTLAMPLSSSFVKDKESQYPNVVSILSFIEEFPEAPVLMESLRPIRGSNAFSTFKLGRYFGMIEGALTGINREPRLILPRIWTKKIWTPEDEVYDLKRPNKNPKKKPRINTKATSLNAVMRLYPGQDSFFIPKGKRVYHDGIVDATLIALYGEIYG